MENKNQKQIYTFLGLPAAGKGTQAKLFAQSKGYGHISIGDLVRQKMNDGDKNDPIVLRIKENYNKGQAVDDDIIFLLLESILDKFIKSGANGIILDNFPFTSSQANFITSYIEKYHLPKLILVNVKISEKTAINRITIRKICPICNEIYAGDIDLCKKCNQKLVSRADDNEVTVKKRIEQYLPHIDEMIKYFQSNGKVIEINGEKSVEEVTQEINSVL